MAARRPNALRLTRPVVASLRTALPEVAGQTVAAIIDEVPTYASALDGPMGTRITEAVQMALGGFLNLASLRTGSDPSSPLEPALDAAYRLGRGEARNGRSMDALLAAYRVGARVAWRELAAIAVSADLEAKTVGQFAELVFAYIDALSAASVSGHTDELDTTGRTRQRHLDRLTRSLLAGDPADTLLAAATRALWTPPDTLTAVVLPDDQVRGLRAAAGTNALLLVDDLPGVGPADNAVALLVPDLGRVARARLVKSLAGRHAAIGPVRPWLQVRTSYQRALRARHLEPRPPQGAPTDADDHLAELVVGADPEALADLRRQVLAPLAELRSATAEKLTETLRMWLLHQGHRDDIAAALFVHPQTIRYRMGQLREMYGDRLEHPDTILAASIALGTLTQGEIADLFPGP